MKTNLWGNITNEQRIAAYKYPKDLTLVSPGVSRHLRDIKPNNTVLYLVPYGKGLSSNVGLRLTPRMLTSLYLTPKRISIFVGSLLGDGSIRKSNPNGAPLWRCNAGLVNSFYLLWLFTHISRYCVHVPTLVRRRDGSFYCHLTTRAMSCLEPIYNLFIKDGKKQISMRLAEWLTPEALAIWAMDDGTATPEGFYFSTHSFSLSEQHVLQQILWLNFGLHTAVHKQGKYYRLYVRAQSMNKFRSIVSPYFAPWFEYKLKKGKRVCRGIK